MAPPTHQPDRKTLLAAVLTVAAVYAYFLIFAQFGFLHAVQDVLGDSREMVRPLMASMGAAGIAGSILAAGGLGPLAGRRWLGIGLACCALAVGCALAARGAAGFLVAAALTGLGAGLATVTLAGLLYPAVGGRNLGLIIGAGTGLAYGFCNLPGIFGASARLQAMIALGAVALGAVGALGLRPQFRPKPLPAVDYSAAGVARWIAIFLALVGLDSALFYFIQHDAPLRQALWGGNIQPWLNAGTHFGAAALAGWALDRRRLGPVALAGGAAVVAAAVWFATTRQGNAVAGLGYIAGVSAYSTALVFYPAQCARPALAAWVYAIAGWIGSALGIGFAETRNEWSLLPAAGAAAVLGISFIWRHFASRHPVKMNENS